MSCFFFVVLLQNVKKLIYKRVGYVGNRFVTRILINVIVFFVRLIDIFRFDSVCNVLYICIFKLSFRIIVCFIYMILTFI